MTKDTGDGCGWKLGKRAGALALGVALGGVLALLDGCGPKEQAAEIFCASPAAAFVGLLGWGLAVGFALGRRI